MSLAERGKTERGKTERKRKDSTKLMRMARLLAKLWANNRTDYGFLRDDALDLLKSAYKLGKAKRKGR